MSALPASVADRRSVWVQQRVMWLLRGEHAKVRANLRRNAAARPLVGAALAPVTACLRYLKGVRHYLAYDDALAAGLPIATGVIEGACRYLVKDRMEKTGARWSLKGAEAVLRLRALRASADFDAYWALHVDREHTRTPHGEDGEEAEDAVMRLDRSAIRGIVLPSPVPTGMWAGRLGTDVVVTVAAKGDPARGRVFRVALPDTSNRDET